MKKLIEAYFKLRVLAGFLGEKGQHGWWQSTFFASTSVPFLQPVFPRSHRLAAYHGVVEAARLIHDERIGVGRVFHAFRLPEELEHELHHVALDPRLLDWSTNALETQGTATAELVRLANGGLTAPEGPVRIGTRQSLLETDSVEDAARHYVDAFRRDIRCFPYFTES